MPRTEPGTYRNGNEGTREGPLKVPLRIRDSPFHCTVGPMRLGAQSQWKVLAVPFKLLLPPQVPILGERHTTLGPFSTQLTEGHPGALK